MPEFNLLASVPKVARDIAARRVNKAHNRALALRFDKDYFDGARETGYGGYRYDGRWTAVAERLAARYALKAGDRVLDVGCAKGFLMHDLAAVVPGLEVWGLDFSSYAIAHAHGETRRRMVRGTCDMLPFADASFACALAINTIHNLDREGCLRAARELQRVAPGRAFIQVDAYRNAAELDVFIDWMLTAKTYLMPDEWLELFSSAGYTGDYYWTILEAGGSTV
ncbi:MAG: methyltransferase domain-containing protein [Proteobacteria bacterium]|nr:methyltransferase domain-containing protein [Pseudomonadota bacterium]